jgi:hypothetical protein
VVVARLRPNLPKLNLTHITVILAIIIAAGNTTVALLNPTVLLESTKDPATTATTVEAVMAQLTSPSFTDRVVASLSELIQAVLYIAVATLLLLIKKEENRPLVSPAWTGVAGLIGAGLMILAALIGQIEDWYFGDSLGAPIYSTPLPGANSAPYLVIVCVLACLGVLWSKRQEQDRAEALDAKLKDVV